MQAPFNLHNGQRRNRIGFMAVNRTKLKELDDATLAWMAKNDELDLIYLHLPSMQNCSTMLQHICATAESDSAAQGKEGDGDPPQH